MKCRKLRAWIGPAALIILTALGVKPVEADTITFNPTGNGNGSGAITGVSNFNYATSSVLAYGLSKPTVGANYPIYYESTLTGGQGVNSFGALSGYNVDGSGHQFTVIAGFYETITGITTNPDGSETVNFTLDTTKSSFFDMYVTTPHSANPSTGNGHGFASGNLVLSGTLGTGPNDFAGSFTNNPGIGKFNTSGLPSADKTPNSVTGGGGAKINVDVTYQDLGYFPTLIKELAFTTVTSMGFTNVAPLTGFYSTPGLASPDLKWNVNWNTGTINAVNGQSLMFQSISNNGFVVVPEPSSIVSALTAAIVLPLVGLYRRGRRSSRSTA